MERMEVRAFDADTLRETRDDWVAQVEKHPTQLSVTEFEKTLDWAAAHMDYQNGEDGLAYGVFRKNAKSADAIIEVVYTKSGNKWLKMLNLTLCPDCIAGFIVPGLAIDRERLASVYTGAIAGTLKLTGVHPSKTVKLYGRSGSLFSFLQGIADYITKHSKMNGVSVSVDGRWLVFKVKK